MRLAATFEKKPVARSRPPVQLQRRRRRPTDVRVVCVRPAVRTGLVLFMLLMAATYFRLWFVYDPNGLRLSQVLERPSAEAEGGARGAGGEADEAAARGRALSASSKQRAVKYHFVTLAAAFSTSIIVWVLLFSASCLNTEGLWEALA